MSLQPLRGARGTREGDDILAAQVLEEIAHGAADELDGAVGKYSGIHHAPEDLLRQIRGDGGGLDDDGHSCEQRRRQLLEHPPDGEVERVDVHGRAFQRNTDVLSDEGPALGQCFDAAVDEHPIVGKLAHALAGVDEQGADPAVDVDPGIVPGGAGRIGEAIELLLVLHQHLRQRLQQAGAVVKRELAQCRSADRARVLQHPREVEAIGRRAEDHLAGRRVAQVREIACPALPSSGREALELHTFPCKCGYGPVTVPSMRCARPRNNAIGLPFWSVTVIS